jgi:hypothetical protein
VGAIRNNQRDLLCLLAGRLVPESAQLSRTEHDEMLALADRVAEGVRRQLPELRALSS